jgi:uncharacterized membrane protein
MSNLIVITYDDVEEATKARQALKDLSKQGLVNMDDAAVVSRGEDGKLHVHDEIDRGVKWGAAIGGGLGLLVAGIFAPIAGVVIGALGGAAVGATADIGIEKKFVKQVGESLETGHSALFAVIREGDTNAVLGALRQYKGHILQTSLDSDKEEELRRAVEHRSVTGRTTDQASDG